MKIKSLGQMDYPSATIKYFNGGSGTVFLELEGSGKRILIRMSVNCVKTMVDKAREIVAEKRRYAQSQWQSYQYLRDYTGYKPPEGQE